MVRIEDTTHHDRSRRPRFRPGQDLTAEELNREQAYHINTLRRALYGLAGSGVVYGYALSDRAGCKDCDHQIDIDGGLAFDRHGRQLFWNGGSIGINSLAGEKPDCEGHYLLRVHYAERRSESGEKRHCPSHCHEAGWIEETVVFTLTRHCEAIEHGCRDGEQRCETLVEYVCRRIGQEPCVEEPAPLCPTDARDVWYAADDAVPLACVRICELGEQCDPRYGFRTGTIQVCAYRPFVYRNPLLFDLIQGCHVRLARVERLSFGEWVSPGWPQPVSWDEFARRFDPRHPEGIAVWFTRPVRKETLHPASVFMTAIVREQDSYFHDVLRIPTSRRVLLEEDGNCARGVRLFFPGDWLNNQLKSDLSRFTYGAIIEFTVRGALVRDACGCMLDGRPLDVLDDKAGQAMPGADFVAAFRVADRPLSARQGGPEESGPDNLAQPSI